MLRCTPQNDVRPCRNHIWSAFHAGMGAALVPEEPEGGALPSGTGLGAAYPAANRGGSRHIQFPTSERHDELSLEGARTHQRPSGVHPKRDPVWRVPHLEAALVWDLGMGAWNVEAGIRLASRGRRQGYGPSTAATCLAFSVLDVSRVDPSPTTPILARRKPKCFRLESQTEPRRKPATALDIERWYAANPAERKLARMVAENDWCRFHDLHGQDKAPSVGGANGPDCAQSAWEHAHITPGWSQAAIPRGLRVEISQQMLRPRCRTSGGTQVRDRERFRQSFSTPQVPLSGTSYHPI